MYNKPAGKSKFTENESQNIQLGQNGFDEIGVETATAGTTPYTDVDRWIGVMALGSNATFALTSNIGDDLSSVELFAGTMILGNFNTVTVSSGTVLAYRG